MTDQTTAPASAPSEWIDGHPRLEAIAVAVYEQCETGDGGIVHDDPRNIAVAALAAVLPAFTDRAAVLREAADIAESLRQFEPTHSVARSAAQVSENVGILRVSDHLRRMANETQPSSLPAADDAEAEAERQMATVQRVRHVLDTEHVVGRTALEYRGLVLAALMADEAQQVGARP
jgi:hypothetical protein